MSSSDHFGTSRSTRGRSSGVPAVGRLGNLLRRAGMARTGVPLAPSRFGGLDQLEGRILLGGDHPDFELPLTPGSGTEIVLDGNTGEGSDTGIIGVNGDKDLFRFTAVADDFVRIWADTVNVNGSLLNSRVEVYSSDGPPPIVSGSNNGNLTAGMFLDGWGGFVAEAGQTYFVVVMSDVLNGGAGSTGDYNLRIDGKSEGAVAINQNPNGLAFGTGAISGSIALAGSDQVFTVTSGSDELFDSLATFNANADATEFDSRLDIYDATGKLVVANSETGRLTNSFATLRSLPDQLFYVRVRADEFDPTSDLSEGDFTLEVDLGARVIPIDPVIRRGNSLDVQGFSQDRLLNTQDTVLLKFTSEGTGRTIVTVRGTGAPPSFPFGGRLFDPALRLYDETGKAIAFNKLFGAAEIQITLEGGKTYFLVVEAFDDPYPFPPGAPDEPDITGHFAVWVEANHTFDNTQPVDDHANTPDFADATPLIWGPAQLLLDGDGNPIADHSYFADALGTGRIQGTTDTDLFSFVPQMDMLGDYEGDDGNEDVALYVGGSGQFTLSGTLGPTDYDPFVQDFLAILDAPGRAGAQKWWNVGNGVNGVIRSMVMYDIDGPDGDELPMMIVGGEFTEAGPTGQVANHIAAWAFDPLAGQYAWATLGIGPTNGVNDVVHALTVWDDDGDQGPNPLSVFVGGEFTDKGAHLARWNPVQGWGGVGGGTNDTVFALTVFDPPDVGAVADPVLIVGGEFTNRGNHFGIWDGGAWSVDAGVTVGTNDTVFALTQFDDPNVDGNGDEIPNKVILGGAFTTAGGVGAPHIASFTWVDDNGTEDPTWEDLGGGVNDDVFALTVWDRDGEEEDFGPIVAVGGAFTDQGDFIAGWDGAGWSEFGTGFDDVVRALTVITDFEYNLFDIDALGDVHNEPRLFAGGDFTLADGSAASRIAKFEVDQITGLTFWDARPSGSTGPVFALAGMNDEVPGAWDRADRASGRLSIVLSGTADSFLNTFLTVYDSNFEVIYTNDTIAPPFPDPSGMNDTALAPGIPFPGITVWGGETYYIEVSNVSGTGRYDFTVRADALPPDVDGDGIYDDSISQYSEPSNEGEFGTAPEIILDGFGDGLVFTPVDPSAYNARLYDPTPSGFQVLQIQEDSAIDRIDDVDLYLFRAPVSGTVELRIQTTQITDQNFERIFDLVSGDVEVNNNLKVLNSPLDSTLTIFNDDLEIISFNDTNAAIQGETQTTYAGAFNRLPDADPTFNRRDARVVVKVTAGDVYFVQVGSGQLANLNNDPESVDWRHATGGYQLLVNAEPSLGFTDDHAFAATDPDGGLEAMIPIDEDQDSPFNGSGFLGGEINDVVGNPTDIDSFGFIAPGAGIVTLTINADDNSVVIPSAQVTDVLTGQVIAQGTAGGDGKLTLSFPAAKGDRFLIDVTGSGTSEGTYTVAVAGVPFIDDHADEFRWPDATELTILDFLGSATAFGVIDGAGDTDLFKFTTPGYDVASVSIQKVGGSLDTFVTVYEVSEDAVGNPIHLRIAFNDDAPNTTDSTVSFPLTAPDRTSLLTGHTYNTYYVLVSGNDRETQSGPYQISLNLTPTDDHPDVGQFDFASSIVVDPATGLGADVGNLEESGDTDLFQFTAPAGGPLTLDIAAIEGSNVRPRIRIFDINQQPVLDVNTGLDFDEGDDVLLSSATFSFDVVRNQTYYILVEGIAGGANTDDSGEYTVALSGPTVDDHANITEFDLATRINLNVLTGDGISAGVIGTVDDTDLFYFTTYNDGTHILTVSTPGSGVVPQIRMFNEAQVLLADVTDGSGLDEDGALDGSVTYTITAGGADERYYLLVNASGGGDDTGSYSVVADGQAPDEPPPDDGDDHPDEGEFDLADGITLSSLTGDGAALGSVEEAGDSDLFVFSSLAAGKAFVQVVTPDGTLLDAGVKVFGPDQGLILADTEGVPGANANAVFQTTGASILYYVEVEGLGAGVGSYTVRINTQPEVNHLYFPEGYVNTGIDEFVSIANPNTVDATYTVTLYYEDTNLAPVVLESGVVLQAGARGGLTLARDGTVFYGIEHDKPYSLVITSDQPLGANFSHYDFGQALGESFTERTSTTWSFARAERLSGFVDDFIVFFNPNNSSVTVTLTAYTDAGLVTLVQTVGANRRGGWNLDAQTSLPQGAFGIRLTSAPTNGGDPHIGIVAALSHYNAVEGEGDLSLGDADGGTNAGVIPTITFGPSINPQITFFNPSNTQISVTLRGTYINAALPTLNRILTIQPRDSLTLEGEEVGLISNQPIGLRYTSTGDVTVLARQSSLGDSDATQAGTQAATSWFFGDAFINAASAGVTYFETLNFYNTDGAASLPVTVTLFFNDGTEASTLVTVGADGFAALKLHELAAILNRGGLNFFSIQVSAERPFLTSMTHYDLFLGGGWTSSGAPLGLLNPVDTIL